MMNKQKKKEMVEFIKELRVLSQVPDDFLQKRIEIIIDLIEKEFPFEHIMKYIHANVVHAKRQESIIVWAKVLNLIKKYFDLIK